MTAGKEKSAGSLPFLGKVCRSPRSPARTEASVLRPFRARRRRESAEKATDSVFENTNESNLEIDDTEKKNA